MTIPEELKPIIDAAAGEGIKLIAGIGGRKKLAADLAFGHVHSLAIVAQMLADQMGNTKPVDPLLLVLQLQLQQIVGATEVAKGIFQAADKLERE